MIYSRIAASFLAVGAALAAPLQRRALSDNDVFNYALGIEYIQQGFYATGLNQFDASAFDSAGFPSGTRERFAEILAHEQFHIEILKNHLGDAAAQPCQYTFPVTDVKSFALFAEVTENIVVSAYLGATPYIQNRDILGDAGFFIATEARHAAWIASYTGEKPWPGPIDTPLSPNMVYTLAGEIVKSCPSTNPQLPFKAFQSLGRDVESPTPGATITLKYNGGTDSDFLWISNGLSPIFVPVQGAKVTLPSNLTGMVYIAVTKDNKSVTDQNIVAGPDIIVFPSS